MRQVVPDGDRRHVAVSGRVVHQDQVAADRDHHVTGELVLVDSARAEQRGSLGQAPVEHVPQAVMAFGGSRQPFGVGRGYDAEDTKASRLGHENLH